MTGKTHDFYLDKLADNLGQVGINRNDIEYIMKDGIWLLPESKQRISLCDLIIVNYDGTAIAAELKGSYAKRNKATDQINYGRRFIEDTLEKKPLYGLFIVYKNCKYPFERIQFR